MNFSKLRKMVKEGDLSTQALRYLLDCRGECEHLDFKENIHLVSEHGKADLARDIVAMRNVGGGYVVIGVQDKTWIPVGINKSLNIDTKLLRDMVRGVTGLEIEVDIVTQKIFVQNKYLDFAVILVRSTAKLHKLRIPSVCRSNFCHKENWGIRQGDIYFRKSDQTIRLSSDEELSDLLYELAEKQDFSELENEQTEPSPFWVETGYYRLLPREYEVFVGREKLRKLARDAVELDPRIWIINLYGPGGVGKSALVNWLAYYYYENSYFDAILQLSAKDTKLTTSGITSLRPTLYSLENLINNILKLFTFDSFINEDLSKRQEVVVELLSEYSTLLILDNLETIKDGRILEFVRSLPFGTKAKVLMTSRQRTAGWEMPIQLDQLDKQEVGEFLEMKVVELSIPIPGDFDIVSSKVHTSSGGLPLAIQWMLGQYIVTGDFDLVFNKVRDQSSPLLEFSFRNSWDVLSGEARVALAILAIFDEPPTIHLWSTALDWSAEWLERAVAKLIEMTFVSKKVDPKTGQETFHALPITLDFARNELHKMGNLEVTARTKYQKHVQEMELVAAETERHSNLFQRFDIQRDTEKRAAILASKAEAQLATLNYDEAERLYQMALEIDPRSAYVLLNYGMFRRSLKQVGEAISLLQQAAQRANSKTGFVIYYNLSQAYDDIRDRAKVEASLRKALEYNPDHPVAQHQLGVVISRLGRYDEAVRVFDKIISNEIERKVGPSETLIFAYKTKAISLKKAGKIDEARRELDIARQTIEKYPHLARRTYELENLI